MIITIPLWFFWFLMSIVSIFAIGLLGIFILAKAIGKG